MAKKNEAQYDLERLLQTGVVPVDETSLEVAINEMRRSLAEGGDRAQVYRSFLDKLNELTETLREAHTGSEVGSVVAQVPALALVVNVLTSIDQVDYSEARTHITSYVSNMLDAMENDQNLDGTPNARPRKRRMSDLAWTLAIMAM